MIARQGLKLGFQVLRQKQIEAVTFFLEGQDVYVSLPTAYGKSAIYGLLPLVFDEIILDIFIKVISIFQLFFKVPPKVSWCALIH